MKCQQRNLFFTHASVPLALHKFFQHAITFSLNTYSYSQCLKLCSQSASTSLMHCDTVVNNGHSFLLLHFKVKKKSGNNHAGIGP